MTQTEQIQSAAREQLTATEGVGSFVTQVVGSVTLRLCLRGELDVTRAPEIVRLIRLGQTAGLRVVVDCRDVTFIDSAGVRALLGLHSGGPVTLVNVRGQMLRILEALRLDHLANTYPTSGFRGAGMLAVGGSVAGT